MARTTRHGTQFSPFELDFIDRSPPIASIDTIQARASLEPVLRAAIIASDLRANALEEDCAEHDSDWEDDAPLTTRAPTPLSRSPSPLTEPPASPELPSRSLSPSAPSLHRSTLPHSEIIPDVDPEMPALVTPLERLARLPQHKRRDVVGKKERRRRHRIANAAAAGFGPEPDEKHHRSHTQHSTAFTADKIPASSGGSWVGPRPSKRARPSRRRLKRLPELLEEDYELVEWDGRYVPPIFLISHF
jgi:hypothetical protein